jgi:hypothetical protein
MKIRAIVNGAAKQNRGKNADTEGKSIESALEGCGDVEVHVTGTADLVDTKSDKFLEDKIDVLIFSGGDGTLENYHTAQFKQAYRRFAKRRQRPIDFARQMNRMARDPSSGLVLPAEYHKPTGTVNGTADTFKMSGNIKRVGHHLRLAKSKHDELKTMAFIRLYLPMMMVYPKDRPYDLDHIRILSLYADALLYNFFHEYYKPKDQGGETGITTAMWMIAKCAGSITSAKARDTAAKMLPILEASAEEEQDTRYINKILTTIDGKVKIDGREVLQRRSGTAAGTMGVSLYGLKPFWRMPDEPEMFEPYCYPLLDKGDEQFTEEAIKRKRFQFICGTPDPIDVVRALPKIFAGQRTGIPGMIDTLASRVEIEQEKNLDFISDGSRSHNGKKVVIEIAYMQPFILLDYEPMKF